MSNILQKWEYQIEEGIIIKKTNIIEMNPVNDIKRIMVSVSILNCLEYII